MELSERQEELLNYYLDGHRVKTVIENEKERHYLLQVQNGVYNDLEIGMDEKEFLDGLQNNWMNPTKAERTFTNYKYER